ncbi:odorant receptor 23a-like [Hyposmocoma kahamanoa]|uniref:odorant receptor 23a-like n=1 Tax=Hyposmocoma kahamanoa TaxID=1477025 RepID=UPI000E6D98E2|nr:odorant receptor 23a-like [Hyposmocoma kahamanoa]
MPEKINYSAYMAIKPHFDMLARLGYCKVIKKDLSPLKRRLHKCYRIVVWLFVFVYNLQHILRIVQMRHSTEQVVNTLFILLTTLNTLAKHLTFNIKSQRVDNIIDVINGPLFAPTEIYHVEKMKENALTMFRILKLYLSGVVVCALLWVIFPVVNRAMGEEVHFTGYIPFDTSQSPTFELCVAYMNAVVGFQGLGNVTMDCTIVACYAQAMVQFQILKYNLELRHLIKPSDIEDSALNGKRLLFIDENIAVRENIKRRLIRNVLHQQKINWFVKEIEYIFVQAMLFQFFVVSWVICMTVYKIVGLSLLSAEFVSMAMYLCCMLAQFFIYCYYGTQVMYQSEFLNQSIYCSSWLSLSPKFRKHILVMMENCKQPVIPRTAYILPISLQSYIAVLRASYTLFTFLDRK